MTTITVEDREILKKLTLQHWDIDEGDLSIYRHVDDQYVRLSEIDGPAETARELVHVWRIAPSLLAALEATEARAEKAEKANAQCVQAAEHMRDLAAQEQQSRRRAEAERDVLGIKMASEGCCYPAGVGADPRCPWAAYEAGQCAACWIKWAAQEAEWQAAKNRKSTTPS